MNEYYSPTATQWAPEYAQTYVLAMQGFWPGVVAGNQELAHQAARASLTGIVLRLDRKSSMHW